MTIQPVLAIRSTFTPSGELRAFISQEYARASIMAITLGVETVQAALVLLARTARFAQVGQATPSLRRRWH
jgi:hypothetical protein